MKLSPTEIYNNRRIFLIGSTGFLGKVTLSMLLHRFPNVGQIYLTVRARSQEESETRYANVMAPRSKVSSATKSSSKAATLPIQTLVTARKKRRRLPATSTSSSIQPVT